MFPQYLTQGNPALVLQLYGTMIGQINNNVLGIRSRIKHTQVHVRNFPWKVIDLNVQPRMNLDCDSFLALNFFFFFELSEIVIFSY